MIDVTKFYKQIEVKIKVFEWIINGINIHCIPISLTSKLTPEIICELYNVELDYFYNDF